MNVTAELSATGGRDNNQDRCGFMALDSTRGCWESVLESEMEADLAQASHPDDWLQAMQTRLLDRASGDYDNYTALTVWCQGKQALMIDSVSFNNMRPLHKEVIIPH